MFDRSKIAAKTPDSIRGNLTSKTKKDEFYQAQNLLVDRVLHLQRTVGNQAVQRMMRPGVLRAKLRIGQPNDIYEQEADRVSDQVMRMPEPRVQRQAEEEEEEPIQSKPLAGQVAPLVQRQVESEEEEEEPVQPKRASGQMPHISRGLEAQIQSLKGGGQPLPVSARAFFEPRFGYDFNQVRVHTGAQAGESARSLNARAFTMGQHVAFGAGQYSPETGTGRKLLAHELTHVAQQNSRPNARLSSFSRDGAAIIQRDLAAYNKPKLEILPCYSLGCPSTYITISAEAPGLRSALSALITVGKVKEVKSKSGKKSWFAANHHKNCKRSDIESAFKAAGYSLASRMARSLYDIQGEYLYHKDKIVLPGLFGGYKKTTGPRISTQRSRAMTEYEIRQARRVFRSALDYTKVTIEDGSMAARLMSLGGYARTVGNTIYFPAGKSRDMPFMIHELTHVWQYQKTGASYAIKCLWAQATAGYKYTPKGCKDPNKYMLQERARGKTLNSYNFEQQGDILADYYSLLRRNKLVNGYQPFVNDVK